MIGLVIRVFLLHLLAISPLAVSAQGMPFIRNYTAAEYGGHNRNYDIVIGEDGTVFVANFEGLLYYDRAQWRMIHTSDISRVTVIYRASDNQIWLGGYNFIARLDTRPNGELFIRPIGKPGLFSGEVMEIFEDGGKLLFVASDNNIYEVHEGTVTLKQHTNAQLHTSMRTDIVKIESLLEGKKNVILEDITQTEQLDGGLQVKVRKNQGLVITDANGHEFYTITEDNGLCSNQVSYVAYDHHGVLWGCTAYGIFAIELPSVYSHLLPKDGLSGEIHAITAFDGKMYAGGTAGLFAIASRQCRHVSEVNNICWMLCESRNGLLAATSSGIFRIAPGGKVSRLTDIATTALLVTPDKIYAGEPDGVWTYSQDFQKLTKVNDLPLVTDIRQDGRGGIWYKNVYGQTIGIEPDKPREPIADLSMQLIEPVNDIEIKAQYRYGDQIWIGGNEFIAIVETDKADLARLSDCRTLRFRSIVMGNDSVLWGGHGDMPKKMPDLKSDERHLHFYYALDFVSLIGKTQYRYRLNDDKWSAWSDRQDLDMVNMPFGSYTLSVQALLANGELSDVAAVDFYIAYPLLMRWYMIVLYFLAVAYIVYLLFLYRLKKLQRDKIKLEQIVEERTADLRNAQQELIRHEKMASVGKLTQGLIDRILNPMNYILNFSSMSNDLLKDIKGNIEANKDAMNQDDYDDTEDILGMLTENLNMVQQYGQNTTLTLKAMEEMLKDRTGGYVDMDLLPVLQQDQAMLNKYFAKEIAQYHITTTFTLPAGAMMIHGNPDMLSKAIMNLLGNAIYAVVKKAQRLSYQPEVTLTADTDDDRHFVLTIRDNGIGIEAQILNKIFDPFFTTKTTGEAAGVGLYLSREIIQNHAGDISVTSVKDEFSAFTITLPKKELS